MNKRDARRRGGHRRALLVACLEATLQMVLVPIAVAQSSGSPAAPYPDPPQVLFQDLFVAVQTAAIYPDGKEFADAVPNAAPSDILAQYRLVQPDSPQALKRFTDSHFALPAAAESAPSPPDQVPIVTHIDRLWDTLTRRTPTAPRYSSLLTLPYPYVVPGGRFREIYYWDSYFTMLGLKDSGRRDLMTGMVNDFAYLIDKYGHVPNGARTYYLSRSQPPFFFEMVGLLSREDAGGAFARYLPQLEREYAFWMEGAAALHPGTAHRRIVAMSDGSLLNRYWDDRDTPRDESYRDDTDLAQRTQRPSSEVYRNVRAAAESGWDFSSRWFADGRTRGTIVTTEIVPVDLNSLLFGLENAIGAGCRHRGDGACAGLFAHRAAARRRAIDHYLWDAPTGAYYDYRWTQRAKIKRLSAATLYPLFVAMASPAQASDVARITGRVLLKPGGVITTPIDTGQQWDAPNGWAPLQWIGIAGFRHYGQAALAETIACRWMRTVQDVYRQEGKLVEKYDVLTTGRKGGGGEYPLQDGFGWTNGVMRRLWGMYPADRSLTANRQCPAD